MERSLPAKPVLKWAGGKRQLLPDILDRLPSAVLRSGKMSTYVEPFSAVVLFFSMLSSGLKSAVSCSGLQRRSHACVQSHSIHARAKPHCNPFQNAGKIPPLTHEQRAEVFYEVRSEYNRTRPHVDLIGDIGPLTSNGRQ